jgi:SnoaL-like domain
MEFAMLDDERSEKLSLFLDKQDILDCLHRYARGMDRHDRDLARSAYHDDAIDDHVAFVGGPDDFLSWAFEYHAGQARHQHYITNHTIDLDGDQAHVETYFIFVATERNPESNQTVFGGRYVDRFERRESRWGIAVRLCLVEWAIDAKGLLPPEADEWLVATGTISQDPSDSSYDRPLAPRRTSLSP